MRRGRRSAAAGDPRGQGGFALLDVMLALTIMALMAAVVLPGMRRPAKPLALRTAAYGLSAMLRDTRATAKRRRSASRPR